MRNFAVFVLATVALTGGTLSAQNMRGTWQGPLRIPFEEFDQGL